MTCQRSNCKKPAVCGIAINVPAMGVPIAEHDPLRAIPGVEFCEEHAADEMRPERVKEWLGIGKYRQSFRIAARGKADPDFERAFISRVEFESDEWKALKSRHLLS